MSSANPKAKEVTVDVTPEAKMESNTTYSIAGDSEFAQVDLTTLAKAILANSELAVVNADATVVTETQVAAKKVVEEKTTSAEDTVVTTLSLSEPEITFDKVLPKVNDYLNIRSEASPDAKVVGKLYKNSYGTILERGKEWTKIKSGNVTGYASNEYLYFDDEAMTIAKSLEAFQAEITAGSVNVRTKPNTESEVLAKAKMSDTFIHVPDMDTEEWVAVLFEDSTIAYVSKDYIEPKFTLNTAVSAEEEEKEKEAAELAKALQEAKKFKPQTTNRAAIKVSDEEIYLLATVVAMEAVSEPYEGKLAVANVVVNRMLDGYWGNSISDVVYAKGQFSGANSGRVEQYKSKVTESCKQAAIEALAGNNNVGDYMYFIMKNRANYSSYSKYYVLGNHCFYSRS
jgi:spore germination cell wall hydrolase CwlJ-like protein